MTATIRIRCPKCGAAFDASKTSAHVLCQICGTLSDTPAVTVDRKLIAEALEQIEASWHDTHTSECTGCGKPAYHSPAKKEYVSEHEPDCFYVHVRDGLKKALG
jgi:NMD protein affecting ribosome stability and mRNA decay